jgi:hypothetical protein
VGDLVRKLVSVCFPLHHEIPPRTALCLDGT